MLDPARELEGALGVGAVVRGVAALADEGRLQRARTEGREHPRPGVGRAFGQHGPEYLRDDVAGLAHDDEVAGPHILEPHLVLVVQRGHADRRPADEDRLEFGKGRGLALAADRHVDGPQPSGLFLGGELVRDGPLGCAARAAEHPLLREIVDLDHHTVDLVGEVVAVLDTVGDVGLDRLEIVDHAELVVDREPERAQHLQGARVRGNLGCARNLAQPVGEERELARRGHGGVLLAQRAGGRIARVRVPGLARRLLRRVEIGEDGNRHEHLAAHLEHRGCTRGQRVGHRGDRAHVGRDVLADAAIAARRGAHQAAALVTDGHGQTIELELAREGGHRHAAETAHGALGPGIELTEVERVVERHHGDDVSDRRKRCDGGARHAFGGRLGIVEQGVARLERFGLANPRVVGGVGNGGRIVLVVGAVRRGEQAAQLGEARNVLGRGRFGGGQRRHEADGTRRV